MTLPHILSIQGLVTLLGLGSSLISIHKSDWSRLEGIEDHTSMKTHEYGLLLIGMLQLVAAYKIRKGIAPGIRPFLYFLLSSFLIASAQVVSNTVDKYNATPRICAALFLVSVPTLIYFYRAEGIKFVEKTLTLENPLGNTISLTLHNYYPLTPVIQWVLLSETLMSLYLSVEDEDKQYYHLALAVLKAATLYQTTRFPSYLTFNRTYKNPLKDCSIDMYISPTYKIGQRYTDFFKKFAQEVKFQDYILLPENISLFPTDDAFKGAALSLLQRGENALDGSVWKQSTSFGLTTYDVLFKESISKIGELDLSKWAINFSGTIKQEGRQTSLTLDKMVYPPSLEY